MAIIRNDDVWDKQDPIVDTNVVEANWKTEKRNASAYVLQCLLTQSGEQSHLKCQLISFLDYGFCQPDSGLTNTCVCDVACIHMSCTTDLSKAFHMQRLLWNGDPNPRNFVGVTKDFP